MVDYRLRWLEEDVDELKTKKTNLAAGAGGTGG
jgi:hypothetical protein